MEATELTQQQIDIIRATAGTYWRRLDAVTRSRVDAEELISVGVIASVERIIPGYEPGKAKLITYMWRRLWGVYGDYMRKIDNIPRQWREAGRQVTNRVPEPESPPDTSVDDRDEFDALLSVLPERSQRIMTESFRHGIPDKEIARRHGVHQTRVSQIRSAALKAIRKEYHDCHC